MKTASKSMAAIIGAVVALGGKGEDVGLVVDHDDLCQQVAKAIVEFSRKIFQLVINCSLSLTDLIALGKFDYVNQNITDANFLSAKGQGKQTVKVELLHFNQYFSNGDLVIAKLEEVNDWLASQGANYRYRFVRIEELLALAIAQPHLQRRFPIGAMNSNSIWCHAGGRYFAYLHGGDSERYLNLYGLEYDFDDSWRFAVVREQF